MPLAFEDVVIDRDTMEIRRAGVAVPVEPQVFDLLLYLIDNRARVVSKNELFDTVWHGRAVSLSTLTSRINAARAALGDTGADQNIIKTVQRRGYRFVAPIAESAAASAAAAAPAQLHQTVRFCTSCDGVRIAYASTGAGLPLLKAGNWLNHLEYDWASPVWSHLLRWLADGRELLRYDARGNGLSDWNAEDISLDAFVRDLEAVAEASGLAAFDLFGASQGCAVSIAYAARHPDRVRRLVLYGGFARGRRLRGGPEEIAVADAMLTLMRAGWGQENPAFRQTFTSLFIPGATPEQMDWFNELQRNSTSPENAVRIRRVSDELDVRPLLAEVRAPTLVLHCHGDAVQPFEEGRLLAAGIPGARFVGLEGRNHLILETDPGWPAFRREVGAFLAA
jgi:DNA-binding winged helix-turn-helix (wHTH) protein/pimeloyl-ACP methyl ester carboxylesterase